MLSIIPLFRREESAVTSVEYALLGSLIAVVIALSVTRVGGVVTALYQKISAAVLAAM